MRNCRVTTIDGPSASGKSTVARGVARKIGYLYVDSGSLYRGITWRALQNRIDTSNAKAMAGLVKNIKTKFFIKQGAVCFAMDDKVPGKEIRTQEINDNVSKVAVFPFVRKKVVSWLRSMTKFGNLVVEGRDIGTVVFKNAGYKFYLDANPSIRAQRRHAEMKTMLANWNRSPIRKSSSPSLAEVKKSLKKRDIVDSTRTTAPLKAAPDAMRIDTSGLSIEEVVNVIVSAIETHTPA